eukprot:5449547-Alexandrium_andersonii.AAC.1
MAEFRCQYPRAIGEPELRRCGIPQGDAWSMLLLALITTPWLRLIEHECPLAEARCLADDSVVATGLRQECTQDEVLIEHTRAVDLTF